LLACLLVEATQKNLICFLANGTTEQQCLRFFWLRVAGALKKAKTVRHYFKQFVPGLTRHQEQDGTRTQPRTAPTNHGVQISLSPPVCSLAAAAITTSERAVESTPS